MRLHTVDLRVDFFRPAPCEDIIFDAVVIHKSKRLIRVDVVCWNKDSKFQIAIGRGLFQSYNIQNYGDSRRNDIERSKVPDTIIEE